jgi:hypothetical protein
MIFLADKGGSVDGEDMLIWAEIVMDIFRRDNPSFIKRQKQWTQV